MNKRQRKKWLKKHNLYINPRDTWALSDNIANYIIPRLKLYKEVKNCYPGRGSAATPEQWDEILDKMIKAWERVRDWEKLGDSAYVDDDATFNIALWEEESDKFHKEIAEGLGLFSEYILDLWW